MTQAKVKTTKNKNTKQYKFRIKELCNERGINTAGTLWTKANGKISSKATTTDLYNDENLKMIRLETINVLCELLSCEVKDLFEEVK